VLIRAHILQVSCTNCTIIQSTWGKTPFRRRSSRASEALVPPGYFRSASSAGAGPFTPLDLVSRLVSSAEVADGKPSHGAAFGQALSRHKRPPPREARVNFA
jgi:hypothetical protein